MVNTAIYTAYKSEKGRRGKNEDSVSVMNSAELEGRLDSVLIVADGMGGRASGALASETAIDALRNSILADSTNNPTSILEKGVSAANEAVYHRASAQPELQGMGTTCVAAAIKEGTLHYAYMGDSRAYLLRNGRLQQLTEDHSFVAEKVKSGELTEEQARTSRFRNIITSAVGLNPTAHPDTGQIELQSRDVILLCTDGLTTAVRDSEIADIMCTSSDPDEACDRLIKTALKQGSRDNITVAVAVYGQSSFDTPIKSGTGRSWSMRLLSTFLLLIIGGVGGFFGKELYLSKINQPPAADVIGLDQSIVSYGNPEVLISHIQLQGRFIALGNDDTLYVVDKEGKIIKVSRSGQLKEGYPSRETFGPEKNEHSPYIASDVQGSLYISHPTAGKILKFDLYGQFITDIGEGKLSKPEALVVSEIGDIFVIDAGRLKIIRKVEE